ncbi:MAG: hypothetical protein Q9217_004798 [Psora testacea]
MSNIGTVIGPQNPSQNEHFTHLTNHGFSGHLAKTYNARTGRCNIELANHLISLIKPHLPPPTSPEPLRILDNACGPLVLTTALLQNPEITSRPSGLQISAVDLSKDFITSNKDLLTTSASFTALPKNISIDTEIMDGQDLKFPNQTFHVSFTALAIFAFPDPVKGAAELHRTLRPGGVAALTTWKRVGWTPTLHAVEDLIRPGAEKTSFPLLEDWIVPGKLEKTLRDGGFEHVEERSVVVHAWWKDRDDMAASVSETLRLMVASSWSEGEKERMEEGLRTVLGGEDVERLGLVTDAEGRFGTTMEAWTAVAIKS